MWHGGRAGLGRWPGSGGQSRAGERENPGSEVEEVGPAGLQGAAIVRVPAPKLSDVFFPGGGDLLQPAARGSPRGSPPACPAGFTAVRGLLGAFPAVQLVERRFHNVP